MKLRKSWRPLSPRVDGPVLILQYRCKELNFKTLSNENFCQAPNCKYLTKSKSSKGLDLILANLTKLDFTKDVSPEYFANFKTYRCNLKLNQWYVCFFRNCFLAVNQLLHFYYFLLVTRSIDLIYFFKKLAPSEPNEGFLMLSGIEKGCIGNKGVNFGISFTWLLTRCISFDSSLDHQ